MQTLINDLYGVLDSNGKVKDFAIDGSEMGVVTAQTNPLCPMIKKCQVDTLTSKWY